MPTGLPALLGRSFALVAAGAALGAGVNALRPHGLHPTVFAAPVACGAGEGEARPAEITPAEASTLCSQKGVVIADARPAERYAEGHVAGAVHLPCDASGPLAADAIARFTGARTIIVYGQSTDEAVPVAESLRRRNLDARVLQGGFAGWERAGLACASGPCDECAEAHR
jgi:rhodanese-related sulfurtransferase